jgi:hypothetical protein
MCPLHMDGTVTVLSRNSWYISSLCTIEGVVDLRYRHSDRFETY